VLNLAGSSNFLPVDINLTNAMSDSDFALSPQRQSGVGNGIADPAFHNKIFHQSSVMVSALAEVLANKGFTLDDSDYAGLVTVLNHIALTEDYPKRFIDLSDAPHVYTGQAGKAIRVKTTNDGLEFYIAGDMLKNDYDTGVTTNANKVDRTRLADSSTTLISGANLFGAFNENLVTMASAATMNIGSASGNYIIVTGTTTITAFDSAQPGSRRFMRASSSFTIMGSSNILIPGGLSSLSLISGDVIELVSGGGGLWRIVLDQPWNISQRSLWALKWTEKFIMFNPSDGYVSLPLPLSRNGTMTTMDFYVQTAGSNVVITVKKNGVALTPTVTLGSAVGKTTLTFSTPVTGVTDDLFTYSVAGAGLSTSAIVCNQKWGNR
jgi:hypothetical protein